MTRERFEDLANKVDSAICFALSSGLIDVDAYLAFSRDVDLIRKYFRNQCKSKQSSRKVCADSLVEYLNSRESERMEFFKDFEFHFNALMQVNEVFLNSHVNAAIHGVREIADSLKRYLHTSARRGFRSGLISREERDVLVRRVNMALDFFEGFYD